MTEEPFTILIADDEPDLRELVAYRLKRSGYVVVEAADGREALDLSVKVNPDLAVIDVMMPRLDGYEVTRQLRAQPSTQHLPVILLTARAQEADVNRGFEVGADDFMRKPFNPNELVVRIRAVLSRTKGS